MLKLLIALALVACSSSSSSKTDERTPEPQRAIPARTTFDWPVPFELEVVDRVTKKGKTSKVTYRLLVGEAPEQSAIRVRTVDIAIEGVDLDDPRAAQAAALLRAIPPFIVTTEGEFIEMEELDRMADRIVSELATGLPRGDRDKLRALMTSPAMLENLGEKVAEPWRAWVEVWVLDSLPEFGETVEVTDEELGTMTWTLEDIAEDGAVSMRFRRTLSGDSGAAADAFREFMRMADAPPDMELTRYRTTTTLTVTTDPTTLLPRRATSKQVIQLWMGDEPEPLERIDEHDYSFRVVD